MVLERNWDRTSIGAVHISSPLDQALAKLILSNIGNARVAGLEQDLGMHGYDLNIALTVFYVFVRACHGKLWPHHPIHSPLSSTR